MCKSILVLKWWHLYRSRQKDQWIQIKCPEIDPCVFDNLLHDIGGT